MIVAPQAATTFVDAEREAFRADDSERGDAPRNGFAPQASATDPTALMLGAEALRADALRADDHEDEAHEHAHDDEEHEVEAEQIHDEIHQLSEADFEEVEQTHVGGARIEATLDQSSLETGRFDEDQALAKQLDAELLALEHDDLGLDDVSGAFAMLRSESPPRPVVIAEITPDTRQLRRARGLHPQLPARRQSARSGARSAARSSATSSR